MNKAAKKKLEENGWRFGNPEDFLGLSEDESAYIEIKILLSESLKKERQKKNITQNALAKKINSSQSRVAKMEAADPSVTIDLLVKSHLALGISKKALGKILAKPQPASAV